MENMENFEQKLKKMEQKSFVKSKRNSRKCGLYHYYHTDFYYSMPEISKTREMHGVKRVIIFCILIVILPATLIIIPLYLRKTVFADVVYPVAESDIIEIRDGISSIFCQQHSLKMSSHFNAFQLASKPEISTNHKHIRLKKSMTLPDDTFEYWGFYLLKGARVLLKFCSRYEGARMLVVKGARELDTCGLLDHNKNKFGPSWNEGREHEQVKVFFEDIEIFNENIPSNELANKSEIHKYHENSDHLMELENKGGEDLTEQDGDLENHNDNTITSTTTEQPLTTKKRRKKLKKGTINSQKHHDSSGNSLKSSDEDELNPIKKISSEELNNRRKRYSLHNNTTNTTNQHHQQLLQQRRHFKEQAKQKQKIYDQLYNHRRAKRDHVYDRKYSHGGNAMNFTETDESNSVSSFETGLFECFKTNKISFGNFPPMADCTNPHFLENGSHRMLSIHEIEADGYYYYIFYSDNDLVRNDIHAIFDIYKPTFEYSNLTDQQGCVNATNCTFSIGFLSDEIVVVEVPTRDGIEHEDDDITYLISTCHPRTGIYAIFPILVLVLILSCSFL